MLNTAMSSNVLQICPYKPPMSGWVRRVNLLRREIEENGGVCEILDIGPSRKLEGRDCIPVQDGWDYLLKVLRFAHRRFIFHCHINGEYFRGLLLALVAITISRLFGNRCLVTFHAGTDQPFLRGWRKTVIGQLYRLIFSIAHWRDQSNLIQFLRTL
jgi:hypothetical protein